MNTKFDFLVNLFKTNPKAHHEWHADAIDNYIDSLPPDRAEKMRTYQHNLVAELNDCTTTEERNQRMNDLFWEQTKTFTQAFDKFNTILK